MNTESQNPSFTIDNIPFGIFSVNNSSKRIATIIENQVVDVFELAKLG